MIEAFLFMAMFFITGNVDGRTSSSQIVVEQVDVKPIENASQATAKPKTLNRELPMPLDQIKNIINLTKGQWVVYRDWDGKQLIYFTHLESWKCGISEVKYGLNGNPPNQVWTLAECDLSNPNAVTKTAPYLTFELNQVQKISLLLTFDDGSQTDIVDFAKP